MLPSRLEKINEALILALCADQAPESQRLEFKRQLPTSDEVSRSELAKDVCAMANAGGGDIVYGVAEVSACASAARPLSTEAADAAKRRILQVLESRLEPRVIGLQFHEVPFSSGGYVLVLRVPDSFLGPHRYSTEGHTKFVLRVGTLTSELDYSQLRAAFDRTASLTDQARSFRMRRIATINARETWRPLQKGPRCVVHLIPITSMDGRMSIDIPKVYHDRFTQFMPSGWGGATRNLNLDGVIVHPGLRGRSDEMVMYVQIFRSGAVEAVRYAGRLGDEQKIIPSTTISTYARQVLGRMIDGVRELGITGPAIVGVALLETTGYQFGVGRGFDLEVREPADRADLVVPELWIESLEAVSDVDVVARPLLDIVWQCFDAERCYEYDENGKWIVER